MTRSARSRYPTAQRSRQVLGWLWDNAAGPVLHALGHQGPPAPGQPWPRLWWVPGGLLSLLPVHAAGHHTNPPDPAGRTVMDRVISSYTPTIGALAHARTPHTAAPATASRSLIVAMPTTPGLPSQGRLRYVPAEAAMLQARLPCPTLLTEPPDGHTITESLIPTKAAVLEHLPGCAIAHFACHGHTDPADPSQSRLLHVLAPLARAARSHICEQEPLVDEPGEHLLRFAAPGPQFAEPDRGAGRRRLRLPAHQRAQDTKDKHFKAGRAVPPAPGPASRSAPPFRLSSANASYHGSLLVSQVTASLPRQLLG
jgi:hypothetical protein